MNGPFLVVLYSVDGAVSLRELVAGTKGRACVCVVVDLVVARAQDLGDYLASHLIQARAVSSDATLEELDRMLAEFEINGVLTFSESLLVLADGLATRRSVPSNGPEVTSALTDKAVQRRRLQRSGVPIPRVGTLTEVGYWAELREKLRGPCVLKPNRGFGSAHTYFLADGETSLPTDVARQLAVGRSFILEEYLAGVPRFPFGDYVSVESVTSAGRTRHIGITGKLPLIAPFRETGQFFPAELNNNEAQACLEMASRAIAALGVRVGLTHTELKLTADGPRIIEVNGRLGGYIGDLVMRATEIDLVQLACEAAIGASKATQSLMPGPKAVAFMWNNSPPLWACEVTAVNGAADVRSAEGIVDFQMNFRPGALLPGLVSTVELDLLRGHCHEAAQVPALIRRALSPLVVGFRDVAGQDHLLQANDLPGVRDLV